MDLLREWMPHGQCVAWTPELLVPQVVGDGLTFLAYALIPLALARFVRRYRAEIRATQGSRMVTLYWYFAAFILSCGVGHALNVVTVWWGIYGFTALWALGTGVISLVTVDRLWRSQDEAVRLWSTPAASDAMSELRTAARALTDHLRETHDRAGDT